MTARLLSGIFWLLVLLISVYITIVMSAFVLAWLMGVHHPLIVGFIIGGNTIRAHASGILTWSIILTVIGSMLSSKKTS